MSAIGANAAEARGLRTMAAAREAFRAMPAGDRAALLAFPDSL